MVNLPSTRHQPAARHETVGGSGFAPYNATTMALAAAYSGIISGKIYARNGCTDSRKFIDLRIANSVESAGLPSAESVR